MATDMARQLAPGNVIGGFRLEQKIHHGGMGTLWRVSRPDIATPLVMKLPFLLPARIRSPSSATKPSR